MQMLMSDRCTRGESTKSQMDITVAPCLCAILAVSMMFFVRPDDEMAKSKLLPSIFAVRIFVMITSLSKDHEGFTLKNFVYAYCAVTADVPTPSLDEAFGLMETVEKGADIFIRIAGNPERRAGIDSSMLKQVAEAFNLTIKKGYLD